MRRFLAGLALALLIASPVLGKAGAAITAGVGPYAFGQSYATEAVIASWAPKNGNRQPDGGYWALIECAQAGTVVYRQFADLTEPVVQSGFTFGPTPSWSGGGADCHLDLYAMVDGAFRPGIGSPYAESATFAVLP